MFAAQYDGGERGWGVETRGDAENVPRLQGGFEDHWRHLDSHHQRQCWRTSSEDWLLCPLHTFLRSASDFTGQHQEAGSSQQQSGVPPSSTCSHWSSGALCSLLQTSSSGRRQTRGRSSLCARQACTRQPSSSTHSFVSILDCQDYHSYQTGEIILSHNLFSYSPTSTDWNQNRIIAPISPLFLLTLTLTLTPSKRRGVSHKTGTVWVFVLVSFSFYDSNTIFSFLPDVARLPILSWHPILLYPHQSILMDISAYCPQKIHKQSPRRHGRRDEVSPEGRHLGGGWCCREGGWEANKCRFRTVDGEKKVNVGDHDNDLLVRVIQSI